MAAHLRWRDDDDAIYLRRRAQRRQDAAYECNAGDFDEGFVRRPGLQERDVVLRSPRQNDRVHGVILSS